MALIIGRSRLNRVVAGFMAGVRIDRCRTPATFVAAAIVAVCLSACDFLTGSSGDEVRIGRDERGMAHVYADSLYGLYYGYGYSIAADRLFQLDSTLRTVRGRAAQAFGTQYLSTDRHVLHNTDYPSITAQVATLATSEPEAFAMLEGFTAGINAHLDWCRQDPGQRMPAEFAHFGLQPAHWTVEDTVLLYVGTMAFRYADFNYEINNLGFLRTLEGAYDKKKAWAIFNAAHPLNIPGSPTTVPATTDETPTQYPTPPRPDYLDDLAAAAPPPSPLYNENAHAVANWDNEAMRAHAEQTGQHSRLGRESASNVWLVSNPKLTDARAVLVNGPQFNFVNPSYVYGVALHGSDFELYGNSLYGYPNLLFAHNGRIGWGSTAGFGDQVDIFQLDIHPEKPDHYYYDGQWHPVQVRQHRIEVKDAEAVDLNSEWTVIGPVVARTGAPGSQKLYARRRAWQDQSVRSLVQWLKLPLAHSEAQFRAALADFTLSINFYYIDTDGQIGYVHGGYYPERAPGHDNRLPLALGQGEARNWRGTRPYSDNPQHFGSDTGYLANWNNRPSASWLNSDVWWVKWSLTDRVGVLQRDISKRESMTVEDAWGLIERSSYADLNFPPLRTVLLEALSLAEDPRAAQLLAELKGWDQQWIDADADGKFDSAANAWMHVWLPIFLEEVFADDIPAGQLARYLAPGYPVNNATAIVAEATGVSIVARLLVHGAAGIGYDFFNGRTAADLIADSLDRALDSAVELFGDDVSAWRLANPGWRFNAVNFRGVPTGLNPLSGAQSPMNRGSENNMFVARDGKLYGFDVVPPGQNAYQTDQMDAFFSFDRYPLGEDRRAKDFDKLITLTAQRPPRPQPQE